MSPTVPQQPELESKYLVHLLQVLVVPSSKRTFFPLLQEPDRLQHEENANPTTERASALNAFFIYLYSNKIFRKKATTFHNNEVKSCFILIFELILQLFQSA